MQGDIVLQYRRVGETYTGTIGIPDEHYASAMGIDAADANELPDHRIVFDSLNFREMMLEVYRWLQLVPTAGLLIQRMERPGLMPVQLAPDMLELLREDPVRYIEMHSIPPRTIDLRTGTKRLSALAAGERSDIPKTTGLRAGVDTMAAAFGETIYLKMRDKLVEHPATGRWVSFREIEQFLGSHNAEIVFPGERRTGWITVPLKELLATTTAKFYLPREWNTYGSWITKEQLTEMYEHFIDEKGVLLCRSEVPIVPSPQG